MEVITIQSDSRHDYCGSPYLLEQFVELLKDVPHSLGITSIILIQVDYNDQPFPLVGTVPDSYDRTHFDHLLQGSLTTQEVLEVAGYQSRPVKTFNSVHHFLLLKSEDGSDMHIVEKFIAVLTARISQALEYAYVTHTLQEFENTIPFRDMIGFFVHENSRNLSTAHYVSQILFKEGKNIIDDHRMKDLHDHLVKSIEQCQQGMKELRSVSRFGYDFRDVNQIIDVVSSFVRMSGGKTMLKTIISERVSDVTVCYVSTQILITLCHNSIQAFREKRDRTFSPVIEIRVDQTSDEVLFEIRDNGPGMSDDISQHIFDATFTTKPRGTGLGLYLGKRLAMSCGGKLLLSHTSLNNGTVFTLSMPAKNNG